MANSRPDDPGGAGSALISMCEREFHLEEYKMIWRRLEASYDQFQKLPVNAALGSVGVFAWLVTQEVDSSYRPLAVVAWLMPFALTVFLVFASRAHYRMIKIYSAYSAQLEEKFGSQELLGWSKYFNDVRIVPAPKAPAELSVALFTPLYKWFYTIDETAPADSGMRALSLSFFLPLSAINFVVGVLGGLLTYFG